MRLSKWDSSLLGPSVASAVAVAVVSLVIRFGPWALVWSAAAVAAAVTAAPLALAVGTVRGHHNRAGHDERGSAALEAMIVTPVILMLLAFLLGSARVSGAHQVVSDAAGDAARAASIARTRSGAALAAQQVASAGMAGRGVSCSPAVVTVDTATAWHPGGSVGVTVTCTTQLGDLGLPVVSGTRTISAHAAASIDLYRQLGP